jgi:hypothetical protein
MLYIYLPIDRRLGKVPSNRHEQDCERGWTPYGWDERRERWKEHVLISLPCPIWNAV